MKQSEFIKLAIKKRGHDEINSMYSIQEIYEECLWIFEELGMLPPQNYNAQKLDFSTPEKSVITVMSGYKWEPESE